MARGTRVRRALATATALVCLAALAGCDDGGQADDPRPAGASASADTPEAAADRQVAAAYGAALSAWDRSYAKAVAGFGKKHLHTQRPSNLAPFYRSVPQLPAAASETPPAEYAAAAAIAERVTGIVTELRAYEQGVDWISYYDDYGYFLKYDSALFDHMVAAGDQRSELDGDFYGPAYDKLQKRYLARDLTSLRKFQRQAARLPRKYPEVLLKSALAYQQGELRWIEQLTHEYLAAIDSFGGYPADRTYDDLYLNVQDYFATAIIAPDFAELSVTRSLSRSLTALAALATQGLDELPATAPRVGDTYRELISRKVTRSQAASKKSNDKLNTQLWMLFRIKELENTPDAAYQNARQMLLFQTTEDARSPYEQYLAIINAWSATYPGSSEKSTGPIVTWVEQQLAKPVPAILEPTRQQLLKIPPQVRPIVDNLGSSRFWDRMGKQVEKALRQAAKSLDGPGLPAEVKKAIAATRPTT